MQFGAIDYQLQKCEQYLDATNSRNTEIEFYLVQFLLVRICAEYEQRIRIMVRRRCSRSTDGHLTEFTRPHVDYVTKKYSIADLSNVLGRFGQDYKDAFTQQFLSQPSNLSPHPQVAWSNIYTNRQQVAHVSGVQMNFDDLKKAYQSSLAVLDGFAAALQLMPSETQDFT